MSATAKTTSAPYSGSDLIPISAWSKDHWSTLGYIETVMVEMSGIFQIGFDPRMRQYRRNFRVMAQQCPKPARPKETSVDQGIVMTLENSTVLNDGSIVRGHDDWDCLQDMADEGLFQTESGDTKLDQADIEPGVKIRLSEKGIALCAALRAHKMTPNGTYKNFSAPI